MAGRAFCVQIMALAAFKDAGSVKIRALAVKPRLPGDMAMAIMARGRPVAVAALKTVALVTYCVVCFKAVMGYRTVCPF
jgi:hypothetical protein